MFKTIIALLCFATCCWAGSIQSLATCTVDGVQVQDPASCELSDPVGATVMAQVQYGITSSLSGILGSGTTEPSILVSVFGDAAAVPAVPTTNGPGSATASVLFDVSITTAGPVRPGWISMFELLECCGTGGWSAATATVDGYLLTPYQDNAPPPVTVEPVTLGTTFDIILQGSVGLTDSYGSKAFDGAVSMQLNEDDNGAIGAPVQFSDADGTPEPATWLLCLPLLLWCACWKRRPLNQS